MDQLDERFNLQTVTGIPEGVIPIEFKYLEQATSNFNSNLTENNNQFNTSCKFYSRKYYN